MKEDKMKTIKINIKNKIARIELNRPEVHNALNEEMIKELTETFLHLANNKDINLAILRGNGKSFSAGADLNWMKSMANFSHEESVEDSKRLSDLMVAVYNFPMPLIGVIHGAALGGGTGLASVCDHVIADEKAFFGFSEVLLGIIPGVISPFAIEKIGLSHATTLFLSGRRFTAQEAKDINLIHDVTDNVETTLNKVLNDYKKASPEAAKKAKILLRGLNSKDMKELSYFTCDAIAKSRNSPEGQEGMSALLEKRKPNWIE